MAETSTSGNIVKKFSNYKGKKTDVSPMAFGKIPPQARDLEEAVIGALLIDKHAVGDVVDLLKPESFYVDAHSEIYKAIRALFERSEPVDILTVSEELKKNGTLEGVGGLLHLNELTNRIASSANSEFHAKIIVQKYIQRELIRVSTEIITDSYEDTTDVFELLDKAEKNIFEITDNNLKRGVKDMGQLVTEALTEIGEVRDQEEGIIGIPSGYTDLDRITSGWQRSDLVIVAARPAMGKTAFVLNMARNAALDHGNAVAVFSLEMSATQLAKRLISSEAEIEGDKIKNGSLENYEWAELNSKVEKLSQSPIFIIDTPAINVFELRAQCRRLKSAHDIKMIFIDYLQLMSGSSDGKGTREQEISHISRSLKGIAKELDVPVIALSQLSRAVETRGGDKKPMLSDLRESGAIEQDADMVVFLYRPEYYGFIDDEQGNSTKGVAEVIIAKHRNGATGTVQLKFINKFAKFANLDTFGDMDDFNAGVIKLSSRMNEDAGSDFPEF